MIWSFSLTPLIFCSIVLRIAMSLHPHSGFGVEPLHGDFEAQRHWVEITMNLPTGSKDWYRNTTNGNELQWWGLDYPPWSAFHALLIGKVVVSSTMLLFPSSSSLSSSSVANTSFGLVSSRGAEDATTILIMRLASLITDIIFYIIPIRILYKKIAVEMALLSSGGIMHGHNFHYQDWAAIFFLFAPLPQLFIDHGHFQFNSVPAGLILSCIMLMTRNQDKSINNNKRPKSSPKTTTILKAALTDGLCAFLATSAVMFKQMSLYFAPAVAVVLLFRTLCLADDKDQHQDEDEYQESHEHFPIVYDKRQPPNPASPASTSSSPKNFIIFHLKQRRNDITLRIIVAFVCGVFGFILPFLVPGYPLVLSDVLTRIFPFARGLYEDKVSNFWCAVSPIFKLPHYLPSREWIVRTCAISTITAFIPAAVFFFRRSFIERCLNCQRIAVLFSACALSFFLFSFQVHEKSILMAVCSTVGIWISQDARQPRAATTRLSCAHFMFAAMVSLQPLAVKDKLDGSVWWSLGMLGCLAVSWDSARSFMHIEMLSSGGGSIYFDEDEETRKLIAAEQEKNIRNGGGMSVIGSNLMKGAAENVRSARRKQYLYYLSVGSLLFVSVVAPFMIEPSDKLPDIIPVMNSMVCCAHFIWYWGYWTMYLKNEVY